MPKKNDTVHTENLEGLLQRIRQEGTERAIQEGDEFKFRLPLPDGTVVIGRGRVARDARPTGFGVEFLEFDDGGRDAVQGFLRSAAADRD